jgi:hypothetical protein
VGAQFADEGGGTDDGFGESDEFGGESVEEESDAADTVYIREDGSGVFVYNSSGETDSTASFGAEMSSGLFHLLANGTSEGVVTGNLSLEAEPTSWLANGSFVVDSPNAEMLESLNVDITSETDATDSSLQAQIESSVAGPAVALAPQASTEGEVVTGPDSITSSGNVNYQVRSALGGSSTREVNRFDLSENPDGYVIDARERRTVRGDVSVSDSEGSPFSESGESFGSDGEGPTQSPTIERTHPAESWGTRERALETLRERFGNFTEGDVNVSITLESYSFENLSSQSVGNGSSDSPSGGGIGAPAERSLIDIEYTVEYTGLKEAIANEIARESEGNVSQETADELAQGIQDLTINHVRFASVTGEDENELNWSVDVENYNDAFTALMRLSSEVQPSGTTGAGPGMGAGGTATSPFFSQGYFDEIVNRSEMQMEAAEAAGLVSRWEWSGSLGSEGGSAGGMSPGGMSGATASANFELTHSTENWESYVNELESRDLPVPADSSFDFEASTADSGIEGEMSWVAEGEQLAEGYQETLDAYEAMLEGSENTDIDASVIEDINQSEFRIAKMDASVGEESWNVEAGAKFDNGEALASAVESAAGIRVTEVVGTTEEGEQRTYVKADGIVNETTEDAVRSLEQVNEETKVRLPGDWEREFPEMDTDAAESYLGIGGDSSPLPGFGVAVVLVAVVVFAAVRRRKE